MKKIPLTQGLFALVDDEDYEMLAGMKWHIKKGVLSNYARNNKDQYMHRLIMQPKNGLHVDHINRDGLDNRRCNLRQCTNAENHRNVGIPNVKKSSKYKGVYWAKTKGKWGASISFEGRQCHLAFCNTEEEAVIYYDVAAQILHANFALLNFPFPKS